MAQGLEQPLSLASFAQHQLAHRVHARQRISLARHGHIGDSHGARRIHQHRREYLLAAAHQAERGNSEHEEQSDNQREAQPQEGSPGARGGSAGDRPVGEPGHGTKHQEY